MYPPTAFLPAPRIPAGASLEPNNRPQCHREFFTDFLQFDYLATYKPYSSSLHIPTSSSWASCASIQLWLISLQHPLPPAIPLRSVSGCSFFQPPPTTSLTCATSQSRKCTSLTWPVGSFLGPLGIGCSSEGLGLKAESRMWARASSASTHSSSSEPPRWASHTSWGRGKGKGVNYKANPS